MELKIENMTCGGCARSVTKAIQSVDPNAKVEADPAARIVKVETEASAAAVQTVLDEAGFPATAR
ncbi:heavy-metal-associated domain-containing protein [Nitratireductor pacificus]|uniref:Heavy metal transport/detoxification protein n=1 Tax=Nitratireductor pacificus pht-3B TaxID=391937 RepID=K2LKS6_9HYPH|nr:heavy-metal-associated domain-containing protein [Nitratireductor pacificus]EKF18359.1 heavy metal transport/detoxification protein [Nitratireductor pacificus pht-3B]